MKRKFYYHIVFILLFTLLSCSAVSARNLINEEVSVPAGSYVYYSFEVDRDLLVIDLSIDAFLFAIDVLVMNVANFNQWKNGQAASTYFYRAELLEGNYQVELGLADIYYIVLDNSDDLFASSVKIVVSYPTPFETVGIIAGIGIGAVIIAVAVVNSNKRRRQQPAVPQMIQTPYTTTPIEKPMIKPIKYCKNCGSEVDLDSVFCSNCGAKQTREY